MILPTAKVSRARRPNAAGSLEEALRATVRGEVRFGEGDRALYATDASNYRHVPIGVVIPRTIDDVVRTVETCRRFGVPVLSRGGGTSLGGQCTNVAVVMDFSKHLHALLELRPDRRLARVRPGIVRDRLVEAAAPHGLTFGPDTATHPWATLGGMLGNNSCGVHSVMAGRTADNVHDMEVLTYDGVRMRVGATPEDELERIIAEGGRRGEIYAGMKAIRDRHADLIRETYPRIPRRVSGYNLDELLPERGFNVARALVGSESTCVTILDATLELVPNPPCRALLVLGYPDIIRAAGHVPEILETRPIGLEGMDERLVDDIRSQGMHPDKIDLLPRGGSWLLAEYGGDSQEEVDARAREVQARLEEHGDVTAVALLDDPSDQEAVWEIRESGLGATAFVPSRADTWEGWEDAAVPPERLSAYLGEFNDLLERYGYYGALYGHFGDGCIHTRITFDFVTAEGIRRYRRFVNDAADLVLRHGGSLSGEHGDGQARSELLHKMYGPELIEAFGEFKRLWDPEGRMNPGRIVEPLPIDEDLRLGTDYNPPRPETGFAFPDDRGDFSRAVLRCVGVGKCRKTESGTMCPSYMVLRDEKHTTRGRAHLLFEMLQGDPVRGGWRSEAVKESLDLCLSCKGCTTECPVNVDIPTYKAEFLHHYYAGRLRPRSAYAFGLIHWAARVGSRLPRLTNFLTHARGLRRIVALAAGMAPEREIPRFADETFQTWWKRRPPRTNGQAGHRVILLPDTFHNHFEPDVARAAVEVLEDAGCDVRVPSAPVCCGRPLYEFGMLDLAKRQLGRIMELLRSEIREGVPIVGLEPSCTTVFRDELRNLFPHDNDAQRLARQVFSLPEYLERIGYEPPTLERKALVHGHCHQKMRLDRGAHRTLLSGLGLDFEILDSGCCGMAGAFGYEKGERYEVSLMVGERVLLPAVREAAPQTLIISDGFSCRSQIAQSTDREAVHTAEVLREALRRRTPPRWRGVPRWGAGSRARGGAAWRLAVMGAGTAVAAGAGAALGWLVADRMEDSPGRGP